MVTMALSLIDSGKQEGSVTPVKSALELADRISDIFAAILV